MKKYGAFYRIVILVLLLILCASAIVSSSPMYGGNRPSVAQELPSREQEVRLKHGIAECVRTAWIGDVNNRTLICVEYRLKKEVK
jgi:hypothetical protein